MPVSGTYAFDPTLVDIGLDAFDRCKIRPSAITPDHMFSLRRSLNQVLVRWANRGLNLWSMEEVTQVLNSGQQVYQCPEGTVLVMEVFARQYVLGATESRAPSLETTMGSTTVLVNWVDHEAAVDKWVVIPIPVSIGGIIIEGFHQVTQVLSTSQFAIEVAVAATATDSGGAVPVYDTTSGSTTVTVTLPDHGRVAGGSWTVHVSTAVGGLVLLGDYTIVSVPTADTLTFEAPHQAATTTSVSENSGQMQLAVQSAIALPQDRDLSPLSRTEWASLPSKFQTSFWPTSYWFDRQRNPSLYIWPLPDVTSPLELHYFRMRQIMTATPSGTETPDIPYRFEEALAADLAAHLAVKWAPEQVQLLKKEAMEVWQEAALEDRERVPLQIMPQVGSYYQ